jgi:VIT1/CCC1 family predicted Fe2+/Mn2+ transporter
LEDPKEPRLARVAKIGMEDELLDFTLYERLSKRTSKNQAFSENLSQLSATEKRHFEFWKKYIPDQEPRFSRAKLYLVLFFYRVFGITFAIRYLERHEAKTIKEYKSVEKLIPAEDKPEFDAVIRDEEEHEREFSSRVESSAVRYISFVVLGLADALVEISGIHAGSLGIYDVTEIAGLAGIIAGGAASLAMASAAFAQAKQGFQGSARLSAVYTGVSYFVTAVILAAPYFVTKAMADALGVSLTLAVIILALATYYSSVISGKPFLREFTEILVILFGATIALYLFGSFIRIETGITV